MFLSGLLELQLYGCAPRPQHEVRAGAVQPQGVLPRGAQTQPLHELRQHRGGRGHGGGRQRGHVLLSILSHQAVIRDVHRYFVFSSLCQYGIYYKHRKMIEVVCVNMYGINKIFFQRV